MGGVVQKSTQQGAIADYIKQNRHGINEIQAWSLADDFRHITVDDPNQFEAYLKLLTGDVASKNKLSQVEMTDLTALARSFVDGATWFMDPNLPSHHLNQAELRNAMLGLALGLKSMPEPLREQLQSDPILAGSVLLSDDQQQALSAHFGYYFDQTIRDMIDQKHYDDSVSNDLQPEKIHVQVFFKLCPNSPEEQRQYLDRMGARVIERKGLNGQTSLLGATLLGQHLEVAAIYCSWTDDARTTHLLIDPQLNTKSYKTGLSQKTEPFVSTVTLNGAEQPFTLRSRSDLKLPDEIRVRPMKDYQQQNPYWDFGKWKVFLARYGTRHESNVSYLSNLVISGQNYEIDFDEVYRRQATGSGEGNSTLYPDLLDAVLGAPNSRP